MNTQKSALIVGASRGLGLAITEELLKRGWSVTATLREGKRSPLQDLLPAWKDQLRIEALDINKAEQLERLQKNLQGDLFDLLFVNAGTATENWLRAGIEEISTEDFVQVMVTNALSPLRVLEKFFSQVRTDGVIGAMSSGQGSIADNERGGNYVYRASKAALNMMMKSFAVEHGERHAFLLLAPGWIKTDLGGPEAKFAVADVIGDIVNTLTAQQGKRGLQYLDRFGKPLRW